ncbi:GNAT family N-acetyltransferase [Thalassococcus sp. S3]|uniref:GNAT family N-acetyltransferase n=1 Tax=Thalassococcus sp. S3 TaxID=2017482 RepID=UPI0010241D81|nr:GNAT family N-acetyltransferase [Thalassococcus sp. S3]QBF31696.1 GNAT family N-acetyltransferase [Thalassococcus sp. S3]
MLPDTGRPPILKTARLVLRPPEARDIPAWFLRARDRDAAQLAGDPVPEGINAGVDWLRRIRENARTGKRLLWSIDAPQAADSIGTVALALHKLAISFVLGRDHWGRGYATEAAAEILRYGFNELGLSKVSAEVVARNTASLHVLGKLGFQHEASFVDESDNERCERHGLYRKT